MKSPSSKRKALFAKLGGAPDSEIDVPPRALAEVSSRALLANYRSIQEQVPSQALLPMIKADAYGHGAEWAAKRLMGQPNLYGLGVASLDEGKIVRAALGPRGRKVRVMVLSGCANWTEEKGQYCEYYGLTPVIGSDEDFTLFIRQKWPERLPFHLKFNTGMNRIGMSPGLAEQVISQLRGKPEAYRPEGIASHLACAEDPEHKLTQTQFERFRGLRGKFEAAFPGALFHIANSSAIWNQKRYGLDGLTDIARPGLSLYGVPPWPGAARRDLVPVMNLKYAVAIRRKLRSGDSIGYGATYRVKGDQATQEVAILSAGYGDGAHRFLSNRGQVRLNGTMRSFLGIVSMDLSAIECDASTRVGDFAEILGEGIDPWTQAQAAGTIPYELLTSVTSRVTRHYVDERD